MKFDKSFLKSKTLYASLAVIVAGFFPSVKEHVTEENITPIFAGIGGLFGLLRLFTKKPLTVSEKKAE